MSLIQDSRFSLKKFLLDVCFLALLLFTYTLFSQTTLAKHLSFTLYDYFLSAKQGNQLVDDVLLVTIDDESIKALEKIWPWPRTYHAGLINRLTEAKAKIVAFDVLFTEPTSGDEELQKAITRNGSVILPIKIQSKKEIEEDSHVLDIKTQYEKTIVKTGNNALIKNQQDNGNGYLFTTKAGFGHESVNTDSDGVFRSLNLYEIINGEKIPSFALAALHKIEFDQGNLFSKPYANIEDQPTHFFYGKHKRFKSVSYADVFTGEVSDAELKDKIIFVGITATGLGDRFIPAASGNYQFISGVELQTHIFEALRTHNLITFISPSVKLFVDIASLVVIAVIARRSSPLVAILFTFIFILILLGASFIVLYGFNYWISIVNLSVVALSIVFVYGAIFAHLRLKGANRYLEAHVDNRTQELTIANLTLAQEIQERQSIELSLRDSEDRLRILFDSLKIGIVTINALGAIIAANRTALFFLNCPLDKLEGQILDQFFKQDIVHGHQQVISAEFIKQLEYDESSVQIECELYHGSSTIPVSLNYSRLIHRGGRHYVCLIRDIREQKKSEIITQEFVATVSHELRTPLTSIRGSIGLINSGVTGELTPKTKSLLTIALRNSDRLLMLVNDILDIQKIQLGTLEFNVKPMDMVDIVKQSVEMNEAYAQSYQTKIMCRLPAYPIYVMGDGDRLIQVMSNLLSNAAKFSPSEGIVDVIVDIQKHNVRVQVVDYGYGIPEHFKPRIFQKFSQADDAKHRSKGTGLGLSITKALIERMSGKINFLSKEGEGSTFYFTLPILTPDELKILNTLERKGAEKKPAV